jgi:putative FmdB family regulatory protein
MLFSLSKGVKVVPIYEYECEACHERFEVMQKFSDKPLRKCAKCGGGPIGKILSAPALVFKGTGWYVTDYARAGKAGTDGKAGGNGKHNGKHNGGESKDKESSSAPAAASDSTATASSTASTSPSTTSTSPSKSID